MPIIYNFLIEHFKKITIESKQNPTYLFGLLFFISIPLTLNLNNLILILWFVYSLTLLKNYTFQLKWIHVLPILLYVLMLLSLLWSIDKKETLKAIPKEITLVIIPIIFALNKSNINKNTIQNWFKYYSNFIVFYSLFFIIRAAIRFFLFNSTSYFFYHGENDLDIGLVPKLLNAIHVSVFVSVAFFYFLNKKSKTIYDFLSLSILSLFLILLSSKNVILLIIIITLIYFFYFSTSSSKMRLRNLIIFIFCLTIGLYFGKIKERFLHEFQDNSNKSLSHNVINGIPQGVHYVSIYEAWNNNKFTPNDYFPGGAFRVYQFRMFVEFISENPTLIFNGFGLNASHKKLEEKADYYKVYKGTGKKDGYQNKNFHNQYIQNFAELGIFGFLILFLMFYFSLKKAIQNKDFIHIAFTFLMISVFLTESFLWRQRGVAFFVFVYLCLFNRTKQLN